MQQLETLPNIGQVKARAIVEYRQSNGAFRSEEELMDVPGIGSAIYETIRRLVYVGRSPP